jgi:phosphatidylinositol-4-phosphate 3-kinase
MAANNAFDFWKTREGSSKGKPSSVNATDLPVPIQRNASFNVSTSNATTGYPRRLGSRKKTNTVRPSSTVSVYGGSHTLGPPFESSSTWYTMFTDRGEKVIQELEDNREQKDVSSPRKLNSNKPAPAPPISIMVSEDGTNSKQTLLRPPPDQGMLPGKPIPPPKPSLKPSQRKKLGHTTSLATGTLQYRPNSKMDPSCSGGIKSSRSMESLVAIRNGIGSPYQRDQSPRSSSPNRTLSPYDSGLFSPISPRDELFVSASLKTEDDIAFNAMLERIHDSSTAPPPRPPAPMKKPSSLSSLEKGFSDTQGNRVQRDQLCQVMTAFYSKVQRFKNSLQDSSDDSSVQVMIGINHLDSLINTTKAVCQCVLRVSPTSVATALQSVRRALEAYLESNATVKVPLSSGIEKLEKAVEALVGDYCAYFAVGYQLRDRLLEDATRQVAHHLESYKVSSPVRVYAGCVCRLPKSLLKEFGRFQLQINLYHGSTQLCKKHQSVEGKIVNNNGLTPVVDFNQWITFSMPLSRLPLECRLVISLYNNKELLGMVSVNIYKPTMEFWNGTHILCMWPGEMVKDVLDCPVTSNSEDPHSLVFYGSLDATDTQQLVKYSHPPQNKRRSMATDLSLQKIQTLKDVMKRNRFQDLKESERELVWESRYDLALFAAHCHHAVPLLVSCVPPNAPSSNMELYDVLDSWRLSEPLDALALLTPQFVDVNIRTFAIKCLSSLSDMEMAAFIPQIVQSLKSDWSNSSPTAELLLKKARSSKTISHHLYWNLRLVKEEQMSSLRFQRLWTGLIKVVEREQADDLNKQNLLIQTLVDVAKKVKEAKDKKTTLLEELRQVEPLLKRECSLPVDPSIRITGLNIDRCSYFSSFTVPLKLCFKCANNKPDKGVIFKAGDDLRQDMLTIQMIQLFDSIWRKANLDLKIVTYGVVATGEVTGMLELVPDCQTLREIQTTQGVTGSLKDHILSDWLMRNNPTKAAYREAVKAFTASCAGYCVASYVLGVCDRHNDNIMVTTSGYMFHIDYGKILGHAQMFGNIKRDRVPFVFTPDMAYVINGGEEKGENFQLFQDFCCSAYQELRKHSHLITNLLELMLTSGLPELSCTEDVKFVSQALLLNLSAEEASATFSKMIEASLKSVAPQINFVIHNFAQMKFSSKSTEEEDVLSFVPGVYSMSTDGSLGTVEITGFQKRTNPDKYHVYEIAIERENGVKQKIFRRYREFYEFHEKLKESNRGYQLPTLPEKLLRSNVQQVAEQRQVMLNQYLQELLQLSPAISQSDLVYTFFHCSVRDERDKEKANSSDGDNPQIKLDMKYNRATKSLLITVTHARNLPRPSKMKGLPHPYVKMYLLPDERKNNKRKSKAIENSRNPTFHETFTYTFQNTVVDSCYLQVSVWTKNILGKECLGKMETQLHLLKLMSGISNWFNLTPTSEKVLPWSSTHPTTPSSKFP